MMSLLVCCIRVTVTWELGRVLVLILHAEGLLLLDSTYSKGDSTNYPLQ